MYCRRKKGRRERRGTTNSSEHSWNWNHTLQIFQMGTGIKTFLFIHNTVISRLSSHFEHGAQVQTYPRGANLRNPPLITVLYSILLINLFIIFNSIYSIHFKIDFFVYSFSYSIQNKHAKKRER